MAGRSFLSYVRKESAEKVVISATTAAESTACPAGVSVARVVSTVDCFLDMGKPVDASVTTTAVELKKMQVEYFAMSEGMLFDVLGETASGRLNIMWGTK